MWYVVEGGRKGNTNRGEEREESEKWKGRKRRKKE